MSALSRTLDEIERSKPHPETVPARWYTAPGWAPGHEPILSTEQEIATRAAALGIRQSAGGYFYAPAGRIPYANTRPLASDWDQLPAVLDRLERQDPIIHPRPILSIPQLILAVLAILALIALFALPADAQGLPPLTPDQYHAAQVAAGEAPAALMGEGAYTGILCSMIDRVQDPRFPDDLATVVAQGYYAPPRPISAVEEEIAQVYLNGLADCIPGPWLYVLSEQDRQAHDLPHGVTTFWRELPSGLRLGVHFYQANPWAR